MTQHSKAWATPYLDQLALSETADPTKHTSPLEKIGPHGQIQHPTGTTTAATVS